MVNTTVISDQEFANFREFLFQRAGIALSPAKKPMLCGRLGKRLIHLGLDSYGEYFRLITGGRAPAELQLAIDLLTTNETYFFREERHFDFLRQQVRSRPRSGRSFRVWSAASSSGEEAYSTAMLLADELGQEPWEVVASDISTRVLERARTALYPMERARHIPPAYLRAYCLKGVGKHEGSFTIDPALRSRVGFRQVNLIEALPALGEFDVVFLRNVMIYFEPETKRRVVGRIVPALRRGGHLLIGHSESLNGMVTGLSPVMPAVYRRL